MTREDIDELMKAVHIQAMKVWPMDIVEQAIYINRCYNTILRIIDEKPV